MSPRVIAALLLLSILSPSAWGGVHTWLGTTSNLVSDPTNWSGGSPVGDPEAVMYFKGNAARKDVVNDVPGLPFKALSFEASGFTVSGESLSTATGTIGGSWKNQFDCEIAVSQELTIVSGEFRGTISGTGRVVAVSGDTFYSGSAPNTYSGGTIVRTGSLHLEKAGAVAIPNNVVVESDGDLVIAAPNQIPDTSRLDLHGRLSLHADETIDRLSCGRGAGISGESPLSTATLSVQTLSLTSIGSAIIDSRLHVADSVIQIPPYAALQVRRGYGPAGGLTFRGGGVGSWSSDASSPITIDGVSVRLLVPNADVTLLSGHLTETTVKSLRATGGTIQMLTAGGDVRLGPGVTLDFQEKEKQLRLNGLLDAGSAELVVHEDRAGNPGPVVLIENASDEPIVGTFAGVPEGGMVSNQFRVTYQGGTGNDVAISRVDNDQPRATITFDVTPKPAYIGEPVTFNVTLIGTSAVPTGSVTFHDVSGSEVLGTVPLTNGSASLSTTLSRTGTTILVRYSGDAIYGPGENSFGASAQRRTPVISSLDPATAPAGAVVPVTVRGSYFDSEMLIRWGPFAGGRVELVSATELRASFDLRSIAPDTYDVTLSHPDDPWNASNAVPFTVTAVDDPENVWRSVSIADAFVPENGGPARVKLTAQPGAAPLDVTYETQPMTAATKADFTRTRGTITFSSSEEQKTITVLIVNDVAVEGDEQFAITIRSSGPAHVTRGTATVTIVDDDLPSRPKIAIVDMTTVEGDHGPAYVSIAVELDRPSTHPVVASFATEDGSAVGGADYEISEGSIEIAPGLTAGTIVIPILGDVLEEPKEDFSVVLTEALNADIAIGRARVVIVDDDKPAKRRAMRR